MILFFQNLTNSKNFYSKTEIKKNFNVKFYLKIAPIINYINSNIFYFGRKKVGRGKYFKNGNFWSKKCKKTVFWHFGGLDVFQSFRTLNESCSTRHFAHFKKKNVSVAQKLSKLFFQF